MEIRRVATGDPPQGWRLPSRLARFMPKVVACLGLAVLAACTSARSARWRPMHIPPGDPRLELAG
jgi:hypothetical protein